MIRALADAGTGRAAAQTKAKHLTMNHTSSRARARRAGLLAGGGLAAGALLVLGIASAASAHVTVSPKTAPAGSSTVLSFSFSHGCAPSEGSTDDAPTTSIAFDIPEAVQSVTPVVNPGWDITTVRGPAAATPAASPDPADASRITKVVFTAKSPIPSGLRDTLSLQLRVPEQVGSTLLFPALQSCVQGQTAWDQAPNADGSEPDHPAPSVTVVAADADSAGSAAAEAAGSGGVDVLARVLGIAGLVVGAVGVTAAILARGPRKGGEAR